MNRRTLVLGIASGAVAKSLDVYAQKAEKIFHVGYLRVGVIAVPPVFWEAIRPFGWIEDQNLKIEARYAETEDQLTELARGLVESRVDVILTLGTPAALAAKRVTQTIPIVFNLGADPIANGLVNSLGRPGGNLTGFAYGTYEVKLLEALKSAYPTAVRFATPFPAAWQNDPDPPPFLAASKALGLQQLRIPVDGPAALSRVYATARNAHADVVVFFDIAWPFPPRLDKLAADSVRNRMPAVFAARQFVEAGGLLSYGPVMVQHWPRLAAQLDRIMRGAKPADLPVEQPTSFELAINLKTAKALGITISQSSLVLAAKVIR